jgi:polysaccharide biosynthesis protein PslG
MALKETRMGQLIARAVGPGLAALAALALALPVVAGPVGAPQTQAGAAFLKVWSRGDWPVQLKLAARAWTWGPQPLDARVEPFAEAPGGQRQVQYWDKARMEVNDPAANPNDPWFVTNGLLVPELVSGRMQTGVNRYQDLSPSLEVVAGDNRAANPDAPSYAAWRGVTSIQGENTFPDRTGQPITGYMDAHGVVARSDTLLGYGVRYVQYVKTTQHNIPDRFWSYLQQTGPVYVDGKLVTQPLYDWVYLTGYPISEAYWVTADIGGKPYAVLVQLFQRRVLTYTPAFAPAWQTQMGNVGLHYHTWRYGR